MAAFEQTDWGCGIYRGRKAPAGSVYDCVNGLIDDEGNLFQRGATTNKSDPDAGATLDMLADSYTAAGRRTVFSASADDSMWVLDPGDDETPLEVSTAVRALARTASSTGVLFIPGGPAQTFPVRAYGGSLKTTLTSGGAAVTEGSATVTGTGTSWLTEIDPGTFFVANGRTQVVRAVVSDTELTLFRPWAGATDASAFFITDAVAVVEGDPFDDYDVASGEGVYLAAVGTGQRLIVAVRQRAFISDPSDPFTFTPGSYLEIPSDSVITGADAMRDSAVVFTTGGVWRQSNLDFDPVDDGGNVQWLQEQISKDVILWGDSGIAAWAGAFVVPAMDDVYLFSIDGETRSVSDAIRPVYRGYVDAGYQPGQAAVHRGHYLLPILDGAEVVDTLVCRLDRPFQTPSGRVFRPWTRWAGHAASVAYAQRVGSAAREPKLLGLAGERVTDLTATFDGEGPEDADGEGIEFDVITSDYQTGTNQPGTVSKLRLRYEMSGVGEQPIDTFDDDGPLAAPWVVYQSSIPEASGGVVVGDVSEDALRDVVLPADSAPEMLFDPPLTPGGGNFDVGVLVRVDGTSSGSDGYAFGIADSAGLWTDRLYKSSSFTAVATSPTQLTDPVEGIRVSAEDSTIKGFMKIGGVWYERLSVTDTTYPNGGRPGFYLVRFSGTLHVTSFRWGEDLSPLTVAYSSDQDDGAFTPLAVGGGQDGTEGGGESSGAHYSWWRVGKRRERIRFRVAVTGATRFTLRTLQGALRLSGRD